MIKSLLYDALTAHVCCKECLRQAIDTGECQPPSVMIRDETMCDFGKWLRGDDLPEEVLTSPHYETTRSIHAQFHTAAADVMELVETGAHEQARQMLEGGFYTLHSNKLRTEILNWVKSLPEAA